MIQTILSTWDHKVSFSYSDLDALRRPIVYVLMRRDKVLYVGVGADGRRIVNNQHKYLALMQEGDDLHVFPVGDYTDALRLEKLLFKLLKPLFGKSSGGLRKDKLRCGCITGQCLHRNKRS